jgi:histidine triad (HIT) family protein
MFTHEPAHYTCLICRIICEAKAIPLPPASDVIYQDELVTAFLGIWHWPKIPVDILVVPNQHIENIYCFPCNLAPDFQRATRAMALTLKTVYQCDGVSTRQHNEPAGGQDVWHYHLHVIPRFDEDNFSNSDRILLPDYERLEHARHLRAYIATSRNALFTE